MKIKIGLFLLTAASLFVPSLQAQQRRTTQPANQCMSFGKDSNGGVTLTNTCNFNIVIIQVANNGHFIDPGLIYPGQSAPMMFAQPGDNVPYTVDACTAPGQPSNPSTGQWPPQYQGQFECVVE